MTKQECFNEAISGYDALITFEHVILGLGIAYLFFYIVYNILKIVRHFKRIGRRRRAAMAFFLERQQQYDAAILQQQQNGGRW